MGLRRSVVWLDGDGMGMVSGEEMGLGIGRRRVKEGEGQGQEVELVEGVDCGVFPSLSWGLSVLTWTCWFINARSGCWRKCKSKCRTRWKGFTKSAALSVRAQLRSKEVLRSK